jgi:hypothetical protein
MTVTVTVIHIFLHQSHGLTHTITGWVPPTETPVYIR